MPTARVGETVDIPLAIGGEFTVGDPSTQPDSSTRTFRNYSIRPNRFDGRATLVDDSSGVTSGSTLSRFLRLENLPNTTTDTLLIQSDGRFYKKNANGQGYTLITPITTLSNATHYLSDFDNLGGRCCAMFTNQNSAGLPAARIAWDGTNLKFDSSANDVFDASLYSRTITAFIDRYFLGYVVEVITPLTLSSFNSSVYDLTATIWHATNVNSINVTAGGVTRCIICPTSTTASSITVYTAATPNVGIVSRAPTDTVRTVVYRAEFQNQQGALTMPITLEWKLVTNWEANHAYASGALITDDAGHAQRCTFGGTSGAVAPAWNATGGGSTADGAGTLVWENEGGDVFASTEDDIPDATTEPNFTTYVLRGRIPAAANTITASPRIKFHNTATPTLTHLDGIVCSLKDGVADGSLLKANHGQQVTLSEYDFDFVNTETATSRTAAIDDIVWTEIGQPTRILAKNTFSLTENAGYVTAAAVAGGRYFVFKRRGMWQFARTSDPNVPIIPERPANRDIGCIGPRCVDVFMDELFWIDEHECYRMKVGEEPKPFCGPGKREEVLSKGSNWVETSTAPNNMPWLVIDKANHDVLVFTQIGKIHVFHLDSETWSTYGGGGSGDPAGGTANTQAFFDTVGQRVVMAAANSTSKVLRLDETSTAKDDGGGTSITNDLIFKPIEGFSPRPELQIDGLSVFHNATASQTGETLSVQYSLDRGATWTTPPGYPIQIDTSDPLIPMPFVASGHSIMCRLVRTGSGGPAKWSLSKVSAQIKVLSGEFNYTVGTSV